MIPGCWRRLWDCWQRTNSDDQQHIATKLHVPKANRLPGVNRIPSAAFCIRDMPPQPEHAIPFDVDLGQNISEIIAQVERWWLPRKNSRPPHSYFDNLSQNVPSNLYAAPYAVYTLALSYVGMYVPPTGKDS